MTYRAEIDGLRALAVVPVILFHAGVAAVPGGFVGVDVFFVISGYLITTLLMQDLTREQFSLLHFYERRARRLLSALFVVLLACLPFAWYWLNPFELKEFGQSVFATSTFSSNLYFYLKSGYFDVATGLKPLLHTWSLAVEEQFYLIYPLLLLALWRLRGRRVLLPLLTIALLSLALSEFGWRQNASANYYLPFSRAWELLAGALAALLVLERGLRPNNTLASAGLLAVVVAMLVFDRSTPFPSAYALLPVLGVVLLLVFGSSETAIGRLLGHRWLVGIGLASYSAYLWHQPIFAFFRVRELRQPEPPELLALLVLTALLSALSYRFVERPFRQRDTVSRRAVLLTSVAGLGCFAAVGGLLHLNRGFPSRNPDYLQLGQNFGLSAACSGAPVDAPECRTKASPQVALWGDSYAMHLGAALAQVYADEGLVQLTLSGCPPVLGYAEAGRLSSVRCEDYNAGVLAYLRSAGTLRTVLMSSAVSPIAPGMPERFAVTIRALRDAGLEVVIISPAVIYGATEGCIIRQMRGAKDYAACAFAFADAGNRDEFALLAKFAAEQQVRYVDLSPFQCGPARERCVVERDGKLLLRDAGHITNGAQGMLAAFLAMPLKGTAR